MHPWLLTRWRNACNDLQSPCWCSAAVPRPLQVWCRYHTGRHTMLLLWHLLAPAAATLPPTCRGQLVARQSSWLHSMLLFSWHTSLCQSRMPGRPVAAQCCLRQSLGQAASSSESCVLVSRPACQPDIIRSLTLWRVCVRQVCSIAAKAAGLHRSVRHGAACCVCSPAWPCHPTPSRLTIR
jgi:hypothetical protein